MALIKEYFELTKKYIDEYGENTILLMQVGAFFEVYGKGSRESCEKMGSQIIEFSRKCLHWKGSSIYGWIQRYYD